MDGIKPPTPPKDLEVFFCPFLSGSNFPNKQSMVQYLRSYHQGMSSGPQRKSRVNRKLIWLTSKIQCNLFLCRDIRECIMSIFCSLIRECNIFRSQSTVKTLESASQLPYRHMWKQQFCCKEEILIQYIKRERKNEHAMIIQKQCSI